MSSVAKLKTEIEIWENRDINFQKNSTGLVYIIIIDNFIRNIRYYIIYHVININNTVQSEVLPWTNYIMYYVMKY